MINLYLIFLIIASFYCNVKYTYLTYKDKEERFIYLALFISSSLTIILILLCVNIL